MRVFNGRIRFENCRESTKCDVDEQWISSNLLSVVKISGESVVVFVTLIECIEA